MTEKEKILLVYKFNHPDVGSLRDALAEQFPEAQIDMLNIKRMIKSHPGIMLVNIFYMFKEYPLRQLMGYWKIWRRFWATTYMHKHVNKLVTRKADEGGYTFTFQTHADLDASSHRRRNFI